jgi:AGCS family alanine or glycine:cation symporter
MRDYDNQRKAGVESPVLDAKHFADLDLDPAVWSSSAPAAKASNQAEIGNTVHQR